MEPQSIAPEVLVDQNLVGRVVLLEEPVFLYGFIDDELQQLQREVIFGERGLKDIICNFGLEVFDAVVLLFAFEVLAPRVASDYLQNSLSFLPRNEVFEVEQPRNYPPFPQYHPIDNAYIDNGEEIMKLVASLGKSSYHLLKLTMKKIVLLAIVMVLCCSDLLQSQGSTAGGSNPALQGVNVPCYISNCASCPSSPFICENCTDPANCCSAHCSSCLGLTCNACETGFALEFNLCVPTDACASISFACISCGNGICQKCLDGTYLNTTLNLCWYCPSSCLTCSSPSVCTSCPTQSYLLNGACPLCSSPCMNCQSSPTNCTYCFAGATLYQNQCIACASKCAVCIASSATVTTCTNCSSGFFLNATSSACSPCPLSCSSCTGPNNCQNCTHPGMLFNATENMCLVCVEGCSVCAGPSTCSQCVLNFYVSPVFGAGKCVSCLQSNCIECVTSTQCSICTPGNTLLSGLCASCGDFISNCYNCSINPVTMYQTCSICKVNYFLEGNQCLPCPAFCVQCTSQTYCTFCFPGFTTSPQGQCTAASPNCIYNPNATHCEGCMPGTYYNNGLCLSCQPNCLNCINGGCTACKVGYYLSASACLPCSLNCLTCLNSYSCTSCPNGQYVGLNGKCKQCYFGCSSCMLNPLTNNVDCLDCKFGTYLGYATTTMVIQACLPCNIPNCYACVPTANGQTQCTFCLPGFLIQAGQCVGCPSNCRFCQSSALCLQCQQGYSAFNGGCLSCPDGCSSCQTNLTCTGCYSIYYLAASGQCTPCTSLSVSCTSCLSSTQCTLCSKGTYLSASNQSCLPCGSTCSSCSNSQQCNLCAGGYYLSQQRSCLSCPGNCNQCTGNAVCSLCNSGFYLSASDQTCLSCTSGCSTCQSSTNCNSCQSSYYLMYDPLFTNGYCVLCPSNCAECFNQIGCMNCNDGYYLANTGGPCQPCQENCDICQQSDSCVTCSDDYYLDDDYECQSLYSDGLIWWIILLIVLGGLLLLSAIIWLGRWWSNRRQSGPGSYMQLGGNNSVVRM